MGQTFNRKKFKNLRSKLRHSSTKVENKLWYKINNRQLGYKFRRQQGIGNYVVDFYCPELKLVIEVDGQYHDDPVVYKKDREREKYLCSLGLVVRRYTAREVFKNTMGVVSDIEAICSRITGIDK
ncbi:MAG: endonuclease domain-containing protein [Patescibacteria group bacterium]